MKRLTTFFLMIGLVIMAVGCSSDKQSAGAGTAKDKPKDEETGVEEVILNEDQVGFLNGINKELDQLINFYVGLKNNESLLTNASVKEDFHDKYEAFTTLLTQYNDDVKATLTSGNIAAKYDELMKEAVTATDLLKKAIETDDLETFHNANSNFIKTSSMLQDLSRTYLGRKM